jgi:hypothetical protein
MIFLRLEFYSNLVARGECTRQVHARVIDGRRPRGGSRDIVLVCDNLMRDPRHSLVSLRPPDQWLMRGPILLV